jgi:hypothetical protein
MRQIYRDIFFHRAAFATLLGIVNGDSTLTYLILFYYFIYFRAINLAISSKLYNFAAVIESRFLYNLRAFSSPAEGVRLPISLMVRMLIGFQWG